MMTSEGSYGGESAAVMSASMSCTMFAWLWHWHTVQVLGT